MALCRLFLSLIVCLIFTELICVDAKKKSDNTKFLEEVETVKGFKKLLRTKTNVLVLFAESESQASKKFEVFGEAASISKGTGSLAWVDCSTKEGKKICKKQKVVPKPVVIQHYKDGEYSSDYDRRFTVKSIVAFLKDPKSDGPWSEEESAKDVVQIESEKQLNKLISKNKPMLVMFYAPWCGHCKRFKPVFAEVATEMKGKVIMAGIDAEGMKDATAIRQTYNITGFPKSIYFDEGKQKYEYGAGHKKEDLTGWLDNPQPPKAPEPEVEWAETENDVDHLGENFDSFIAENEKVLVFFYAPWCGHCKNLKPEWEKAATQIKEQEISGKLAALDATKHREFGDRYKVTGYPTIIYFENGEKKYDASGAFKRDADGIVAYIQNPSEPPPPEKDWSEVESDVLHLDDESFKSTVRKKKHTLVMFYAPWCGHCKAAKPEYVKAASQFAGNNKVELAAVDCTKSKDVCSTYEVKGYPTFYYVNYGKNEEKYSGGRVENDFVNFINNKERETQAANYTSNFWKKIEHSNLLYHLTDETWYDFVHSHPRVLLTVYNEECPNCKQVRKELADCAKAAKDEQVPVKIAVINSEIYEDIYRIWTEDMGVPTIFWYKNGIKQFEYIKSRASQDLLKFIKNPVKPEAPKTYSDWSMQESAEDIYHLNDQGFDQFAKEQEDMMVVFYSPTCAACKQIRRAFEEAASRLDDEKPEATLVAVNIAQNHVLRDRYEITSYPYFAYFKDGIFKYKYKGSHEADAMVKFMKKPTEPKKEVITTPDSNVTSLTDDDFDKFIKKHKKVLVMFQTSWCGHCRHFKPKFKKASDILVTKNPKAKLGTVDGSVNKKLLEKYDVHGFPTILYFENGKFADKYPGKRTTDSVVEFMTGYRTDDKAEREDEIMKSKPRAVTSLNATNFPAFLQEKSRAMVMFYSPGCGACKTAKRPFFQTAVELDEENYDINMGIMDAFKHRDVTEKYKLTGYPTFWYFEDGEMKFKYTGPRDQKSFLKFINEPVESEKSKSGSTVQWISEKSEVEHLNINTFDKLLGKYRDVMVFFYINACDICLNQMKPVYVEAGNTLYNMSASAKLTAVNAAWEKELSTKYSVNSFPTVLYFRKGEYQYKYQGPFTEKAIVNFMKDPKQELAEKQRPTAWQDMSPENFGHVTHLSNATFDQYLTKHDHSIVMFHSLFYERCKAPRQQYKIASDILSSLDHVGLGAVDCHRSPPQGLVCYHLSVKTFPSYQYYRDSTLSDEPTFSNAKEIVSYLQKKMTEPNKDEL